MQQPKPIHISSVEEIITMDALTKRYRGYMNSLSFKGKWSGRRAWKCTSIFSKLDTVLKVGGFRRLGKGSLLKIDNTTAVAYLMKEGGTQGQGSTKVEFRSFPPAEGYSSGGELQ